jgi:hypothetical protein
MQIVTRACGDRQCSLIRWRFGSASSELYPARKDRPVAFALPPITGARDAADLMAAVTNAVATGHITPSEATEIGKVIDAYVRAYQTAEPEEPGCAGGAVERRRVDADCHGQTHSRNRHTNLPLTDGPFAITRGRDS